MYHKHHTEGIVLASVSESTDNKRLILLTKDLGVVIAQVKSARSGLSKLKPGIQEYSFGEYSLLHGKIGWRCVSVSTLGNYYELVRNDPEKITVLSRVLKLLRTIMTGEEPNQNIFEIVENFLKRLVGAEARELSLLESLVLSRILFELGFLRHEEKFHTLVSRSSIEKQDLTEVDTHRTTLIKLINEALKAAEIMT
jgi:recombinational DNA repair protein (RecF pathway)